MSEKSAQLKVDGLPSSITESQLSTVLGNKRRKGGGPVDNIKLIKDGEKCSAIVTFEESEAVDTILKRGDTVEIQGIVVKVQRYLESCETNTCATPPRNAPKISETVNVEHSPQDNLSGRDSSPEGAKSKPLSEKSKNKPVPKSRTVKQKSEKSVDSKRRQSLAKSETGDSTSDHDDFSATDSSHKNEKNKASKTHKKTVKKGNKEIVDDSSASESSPEKSKNKKDKSVNKSTAKKEQSPASKKPSAQKKEPNPQRSKSNTQTRSSDDEDLSGADTLAEESRDPTRKSIKAPVKGKKSALAESIPSSSDEDEDPSEPWKVTIKATVKDLGKSKEFYIYYFEDSEISQGPFYEDSLMWDGLKRNVYMTFHTRQAALASVRFQHKPDSNLLKVEMATEGDFDTHSNLLSVHGQLCDTDEQRRELMKAVQQQTEMDVVNIIQQDEPRSAIIVFDPNTCQGTVMFLRECTDLDFLGFQQNSSDLGPGLQNQQVRVSGIYSLTSDDTLKHYMSNKKRSCGGEVTFLKRQSPTEAVVAFKQREDFDGFLGKSNHKMEQCELHVSAYYQCLSPETYKQIGEHVKETHRVNRVEKSHQVHPLRDHVHNPIDNVYHPKNQEHNTWNQLRYPREQVRHPMDHVDHFRNQMHYPGNQMYNPRDQVQHLMDPVHQVHQPWNQVQYPRDQVDNPRDKICHPWNQVHRSRDQGHSVQRSTSLHKLNCTFCPLYSAVKCNNSKAVQHTLKLCKFGTAFLMRRSQDLQELMKTCHCKYSILYKDNCISLKLDWPQKITLREVKIKTKSGVDDFCKYLDTFISAQCAIDNSYIHEFQEFIQSECQEEKPVVEVFFDHQDNLAVFISEHDEAGLQNFVNKMFHNFMSHIPKVDGSAGTPSLQVALPKDERNAEVKAVSPEQHPLKLEQILEIEEKDLILFQKTNFHKEVEARNKPMEIIFNSDTMNATIKGNDTNSINCAQIELLKKARDFVRLSVRDIFSPEQLQLLNKKDVQDRINKMFEEKGHQAHFKCSADLANLFYVSPLDDAVLKEIIESHVVLKTKTLDSDLAFLLKSDKGQKFLSALCESTDGIRMSSLVALKETCLQIISSAQQLDVLMKEVSQFAEANKSYEKKVQFSSGKQLFAQKFLQHKLSNITKSLTPLGAKIIYNAESVTVQGLKDGVNLGETQLSNLSEQIVVQDFLFKFFGIKEFLQTPEGKSLLTNVETSKSCFITSSSTESQTGLSGSPKAFQGMQTQPSKPPNLIAQAKVVEDSLLPMERDITRLRTVADAHYIDSALKLQSHFGRALLLRGNNNHEKQFNSVKLTIKKGDITAEKCDAIVSGIKHSMDMASSGAVCQTLLKMCGSALQDECKLKITEMAHNNFVTTSAPNLNCKRIYHVSMNKFQHTWDRCISQVLTDAESQGLTSIALPAFGTGAAFADHQQIKQQIFGGVKDFSRSSKGTLKDVRLVVFSQELLDEFLSGDSSKHASDSSHEGDKNHEKQFNSVRLTIKKGDITAEKCDAIVSGIQDSMEMANSGAVCQALLRKCGSALQDECKLKINEMAQKNFVTTSAPNLNCKRIYHVSMNKFLHTWDRCISQVLTDAESQGLTSIALPAFGTGTPNPDNQLLKQQIFSGVSDFSRSSKGTLKDVRLVVFSQVLLDEFLSKSDSSKHVSDSSHEVADFKDLLKQYWSAPQAEVTATQSLKKVSEQVALKVYADSYTKIVTASKEINTAFKQAFREQIEKQKDYRRLSKHQVLQLEMEGIKHCLKVSVSVEDGVVTMTGFKVEGFIHVVKMLGTLVVAAVTDHHKSLTEAVEAAIQWQFEQLGSWRNFEPIMNGELEKEYKNKAKHHDVTDSINRTYRIFFAPLKEYLLDENGQKCGHSIKVRRYDRAQEGEPLPKEWETMGDSENLKLVTLQAGSPEYKNAEQLFIKGGANMPVKKIQRIQNRSLYQQYKAKKREMDLRNPKGHINEQKLFHGTDSTSVTAINDNGFNRSYCGKNATVYGNGVYFAVASSYSVGYANPSASGERLMYIASVLTGVSTPSRGGMTHLPNKPGTNTPYDSGNATGMFIIFHDSQAYPEYLLTF